MADINKGCFCKSIAGHDKETYYIIVDIKNVIFVADGKIKKLNNPKCKNPKHLEILDYRDEVIDQKLAENKLRDEDIKYSIKKFLTHINR